VRGKITILKQSKALIDYNYQYGIASMLYKKLAESDVELANEAHSHQGFKYYTFSNLILEDRKPSRNGLNFNRAHFYLSSPDTRFIKSFTEGLLMNPEFYLKGVQKMADFTIQEIEILPQPEFNKECTFKTLSPIYVKTQRYQGERLKEHDLYPNEPKFYENLHKNLIERYTEFHNKTPEKDHFEITKTGNIKLKRIKIAENYRRCTLLTLHIQSTPELLQFAYDAGLGEKNAMGFGCIDIIEREQHQPHRTMKTRAKCH